MTDAILDDNTIACPRCAFAASRNFCANCGTDLRPRHPALRVARSVLGPLADYVALFPALVKPRWLIDEIENGRVGMADAIAFSLAAAGVAAVVTWIFPAEQTFPSLPPIASELAEATIAVGANAVGNLPLAWVLQRGNPHRVPLAQCIALAMALLALLYPIIALADGLLAAAGIRNADSWTYLVSLGWYAVAYGKLYRCSWWKVLLWIAALWAALLVLIVFIVIAVAVVLAASR